MMPGLSLRSWLGVLLVAVSLSAWSAPSRLEALPPGLRLLAG